MNTPKKSQRYFFPREIRGDSTPSNGCSTTVAIPFRRNVTKPFSRDATRLEFVKQQLGNSNSGWKIDSSSRRNDSSRFLISAHQPHTYVGDRGDGPSRTCRWKFKLGARHGLYVGMLTGEGCAEGWSHQGKHTNRIMSRGDSSTDGTNHALLCCGFLHHVES